jgi:hypothetical protein
MRADSSPAGLTDPANDRPFAASRPVIAGMVIQEMAPSFLMRMWSPLAGT